MVCNPSEVHGTPEIGPQEPAPRSSETPQRRGSDVIEATELFRIRTQYNRATSSYRAATAISPSQDYPTRLGRLSEVITKFWRNQISIIVAHEASRDHLALERTFLGYLRTSLALSMIGVSVAQLFRLQNNSMPNAIFGFYVLGKPLACICQGAAIYALLLGAYRSWRHQHALARGKAIVGGFEVIFLGIGTLTICIMFFVLLIAVDVSKEY